MMRFLFAVALLLAPGWAMAQPYGQTSQGGNTSLGNLIPDHGAQVVGVGMSIGTTSYANFISGSVNAPIETYAISSQVSGGVLIYNAGNTLKLNDSYYIKLQVPSLAPTVVTASSVSWTGSLNTPDYVIKSASTGTIKISASSGSFLPSAIGGRTSLGFYVMPVNSGTWEITAVVTDGTKVSQTATNAKSAFFGFYNLSIPSTGYITVTATCVTTCGGDKSIVLADIFDGSIPTNSAWLRGLPIGPKEVVPTAGTSFSVVTGGTAVTAVVGHVNGCYITNPLTAADQGIATAEAIYVDPVGTAPSSGVGSDGTAVPVQPGQQWSCIPGQTTDVTVNAVTSGHSFTVVKW